MPTRCYCLLLLLLLLAGCTNHPHVVTRGFYYWKTSFRPTAYEQERLQAAGCSTVYLRCFDVDRAPGGTARPIGVIRNLPDAAPGLTLVPVVYITQDALNATSGTGIPELAANISHLLESLWQGKPAPTEIQIDCDWTASSRDRYFSLLRSLRRTPFFRDRRLSCTIRLHQVKFQSRSGVPPVDRGLLMCYNMGSLKKPGSHNSILNPGLAKEYLTYLSDYPLPLDVALPLFEWCLLFRNGRLRGIMREVTPEMVLSSPMFEPSGTNLYNCLRDGNLAGYELHSGDVVRVERSRRNDILQMATYAARRIRNDSLRVLLFHCDSLTLAKHPHDELEAIYRSFD